jgi:hypothetical protein
LGIHVFWLVIQVGKCILVGDPSWIVGDACILVGDPSWKMYLVGDPVGKCIWLGIQLDSWGCMYFGWGSKLDNWGCTELQSTSLFAFFEAMVIQGKEERDFF